MIFEPLADIVGGQYLNLSAEADEPCHELRADDDLYIYREMIVAEGGEGDVFAEAVDGHPGQLICELEPHAANLSAVHAEEPACVPSLIDRGRKRGQVRYDDIAHLIDPEMAQLAVIGAYRHKVIVFVVPDKEFGADMVSLPVVAEYLILVAVVFKIFE